MKGTKRIVILALAVLLVLAFATGAASKKGGKGAAGKGTSPRAWTGSSRWP